jgi:signal transduction histidine kinase
MPNSTAHVHAEKGANSARSRISARIANIAGDEAMQKKREDAAVAELVAWVAHEISNPLASISSAFQLIKDAVPVSHPHHSQVGRIETEIDRIGNVIRQMLDLHQPLPQHHHHANRRTATALCLSDAISKAVAPLKHKAKEKGVRISIARISPKTRVSVSEAWLGQVLLNLVRNAIDACPSTEGCVHLSVAVNTATIAVIVEDNGCHIDREVFPRLFDPSLATNRAIGHSRAGDRPGLGQHGAALGLSVSKKLVEAMGARIEMESESGTGSRFHLILPRALALESTQI